MRDKEQEVLNSHEEEYLPHVRQSMGERLHIEVNMEVTQRVQVEYAYL